MKKKVRCLCCGYRTLDERGGFDICPVCFWEDDCYLIFDKKDENGNIMSVFHYNNSDDDEYDGEDILTTRAIEKGMPIEQVQKILGHEQIDL